MCEFCCFFFFFFKVFIINAPFTRAATRLLRRIDFYFGSVNAAITQGSHLKLSRQMIVSHVTIIYAARNFISLSLAWCSCCWRQRVARARAPRQSCCSRAVPEKNCMPETALVASTVADTFQLWLFRPKNCMPETELIASTVADTFQLWLFRPKHESRVCTTTGYIHYIYLFQPTTLTDLYHPTTLYRDLYHPTTLYRDLFQPTTL